MRYFEYAWKCFFIVLISLIFTHCSQGGRGSGGFPTSGTAPATEASTAGSQPTFSGSLFDSAAPGSADQACLDFLYTSMKTNMGRYQQSGVSPDGIPCTLVSIGAEKRTVTVRDEFGNPTEFSNTGVGQIFVPVAVENLTLPEYRNNFAQGQVTVGTSVVDLANPPKNCDIIRKEKISDFVNNCFFDITLCYKCPAVQLTPEVPAQMPPPVLFSSTTVAQGFLGPHTPSGPFRTDVISKAVVVNNAEGMPTGLSLTFVPGTSIDAIYAKLLSDYDLKLPVVSVPFSSGTVQQTYPDGTGVSVSITKNPDGSTTVDLTVNRSSTSTVNKAAIVGSGFDPATVSGFYTGSGVFLPGTPIPQ